MLLVIDLCTISEMRIISDAWNWSIINQIFFVRSVKSVINIKLGKVSLNWTPNKMCRKVFNEP